MLTLLVVSGDCGGVRVSRSTATPRDCGGVREGMNERCEGVGVGGELASEPGMGGSAGANRAGVEKWGSVVMLRRMGGGAFGLFFAGAAGLLAEDCRRPRA